MKRKSKLAKLAELLMEFEKKTIKDPGVLAELRRLTKKTVKEPHFAQTDRIALIAAELLARESGGSPGHATNHQSIPPMTNESFLAITDVVKLVGSDRKTVQGDLRHLADFERFELIKANNTIAGIQLETRASGHYGMQRKERVPQKISAAHAALRYLLNPATRLRACTILQGTTLYLLARLMRGHVAKGEQLPAAYWMTNSPPVFRALRRLKGLQLMTTGGEYRRHINAWIGRAASRALAEFHPTHIVIGASGLEQGVIFQADDYEIVVSQTAIDTVMRARGEIVVVVDQQKIGQQDPWNVSDLNQADGANIVIATELPTGIKLSDSDPLQNAGFDLRHIPRSATLMLAECVETDDAHPESTWLQAEPEVGAFTLQDGTWKRRNH